MFKDNILQGKNILVTGGGTGLGKEMSEHYLQHGADVVICGRRESVLAETAAEFKEKYGSTVRYQALDIRSAQDVDDFIDTIFQEGPLHGLVNMLQEILSLQQKIFLPEVSMQLLTLFFMEPFM